MSEELTDYARMKGLYASLSATERLLLVEMWDGEQGLDLPNARLKRMRDAPERAKTVRFWLIVGAIPALLLCLQARDFFIHIREAKQAAFMLDALREKSKTDTALGVRLQEAEEAYRDVFYERGGDPRD